MVISDYYRGGSHLYILYASVDHHVIGRQIQHNTAFATSMGSPIRLNGYRVAIPSWLSLRGYPFVAIPSNIHSGFALFRFKPTFSLSVHGTRTLTVTNIQSNKHTNLLLTN